MFRASPFFFALLLIAAPASAWCAETEAEAEAPRPPSAVGVDLGLSAPAVGGDGSFFVLVPQLFGRASFGPGVEGEFDLGLAIVRASSGGGSDTAVRVGNPTVTLRYHVPSSGADFSLGLGLTLPLARLGEQPFESVAVLLSAAAIDGNRDFWKWLPDTFAMFLPVRWEGPFADVLRFTLEGAAALYLATTERNSTATGFQALGRIAYAIDRSWYGIALQGNVFVVSDAPDLAQLAIVPQAHVQFGSNFLDARLVLNLDEPYGFAFDEGGFWGLFVGFGVEI